LFGDDFTKEKKRFFQGNFEEDVCTVIVSDMNWDFQAFHIQQHVMFHVWLFHYKFSNHLMYVPKFQNKRKIQNPEHFFFQHTCSKPGSLWYGFSDINDWIEISKDEIHWAGDHDGPLHVLKTTMKSFLLKKKRNIPKNR
jgi:hypothetical protein